MKTKLLKLVLSAMALLPMGAWADVKDVVDNLMVFDEFTAKEWTTASGTSTEDGTYITLIYGAASNVGMTITSNVAAGTINGTAFNAEKTCFLPNTNNSSAILTDGNWATIRRKAGVSTYLANNTFRGKICFNVSTSGTLYIHAKKTGGENNTYLHVAFQQDTKVDTKYTVTTTYKTMTTTATDYSITVTDGGTFYMSSSNVTSGTGTTDTYGTEIEAMYFVPDPINVTIGATGFATFGNNKNYAYSIPSGMSVYAATSMGSYVKLTAVTQIRPTNGYIIAGTPNTYSLTPATDGGATSNKGGEMVRVNADIANFPASVIESETTKYQYILANDEGTAKFFAPDGTSTLAAGKAYLKTTTQLSAGSGARGFNIVFEDETTAINAVATKNVNNGKYYNLQGVEVTHPTKGLYIVNGKKVFIK